MGLKNTAHLTRVCHIYEFCPQTYRMILGNLHLPFAEVGNITKKKNRLRAQSGSAYCLAYYKNGPAQIR